MNNIHLTNVLCFYLDLTITSVFWWEHSDADSTLDEFSLEILRKI